MGNCNCKEPRIEPYVQVEEIHKPVIKKTIDENFKLIKMKSLRYHGENITSLNKVAEIETNGISQIAINQQGDSKNDATDFNSKKLAESLILEYDINEDEQKKLKGALFKHSLFMDMNDEVL